MMRLRLLWWDISMLILFLLRILWRNVSVQPLWLLWVPWRNVPVLFLLVLRAGCWSICSMFSCCLRVINVSVLYGLLWVRRKRVFAMLFCGLRVCLRVLRDVSFVLLGRRRVCRWIVSTAMLRVWWRGTSRLLRCVLLLH